MLGCGSIALVIFQAAPASGGIPFRTESTVSMDRLVLAMVVLVLVLVCLVAALYLARKKGWLNRIAPHATTGQGQGGRPELSLRTSRRISAFTSVHVLAHGDREFVVVESVRGATAQLHMLPVPSAGEAQERSP
jgi:hypothetical protein